MDGGFAAEIIAADQHALGSSTIGSRPGALGRYPALQKSSSPRFDITVDDDAGPRKPASSLSLRESRQKLVAIDHGMAALVDQDTRSASPSSARGGVFFFFSFFLGGGGGGGGCRCRRAFPAPCGSAPPAPGSSRILGDVKKSGSTPMEITVAPSSTALTGTLVGRPLGDRPPRAGSRERDHAASVRLANSLAV